MALLFDKNITKTDLSLKTDIVTSILAKLSKNEQASMEVLPKICNVPDCGLDDVIEIYYYKKNPRRMYDCIQ